MIITQLYDEIYRALARDSAFMDLMGLTSADNITIAKKIQKRRKPQNIIDNMPIVSFYSPGGAKDRENDLVFGSVFVFDVYTNDDVELAQNISSVICKIFNKQLLSFAGIESFESMFADQSESLTDFPNTYCFTTLIVFYVSLDND
jgi:hypothetical protein